MGIFVYYTQHNRQFIYQKIEKKLESVLDPNFVYLCRLGNSEKNLPMTEENIILLQEAEPVGN